MSRQRSDIPVKTARSAYLGPVCIMASALLWSTAGLLIKYVPWHPMAISSMRSLLAALVFLAVFRGRLFTRPNRMTWLSGLALVATQTGYVVANKLTTATNAIMLQYTSPFFILILGALIFHYRPTRREIVTLAIATAGIVLFFFDQISPGNMLGNVLALFTGFTFAGVFILNNRPECNTRTALFIGQVGTFLIGLPFVFTVKSVESSAVISIVLLGLFQLGVAYVLFSIGVVRTKPLNASLLAMIEPIMNPVWVFLFIGEKPGFYALIGTAIVIGSLVFLNVGQLKRTSHIKTAP